MTKRRPKRKAKRPALRFIPNPVQVQGFNVQRITVPVDDPDRFAESFGPDVARWVSDKQILWQLQKSWRNRQRRAVALGVLLGLGLVSSWLGLFYAMAG